MGHNPSRAARQVLLSDRLDFLLRVRCCGTRHYRIEDVIQAFGDLAVIGMEAHLRCEVCGENQWLRAGLELPSAAERARIRVRRLVRVDVKRIPVWRDE